MSPLQRLNTGTLVVLVGALVAVVRPLLLPALAFEAPTVLEVLGTAGGVVAGMLLAQRFGGRSGA